MIDFSEFPLTYLGEQNVRTPKWCVPFHQWGLPNFGVHLRW